MLRFISHRLFHAIFFMLAVSLIAFSLFRFVGDPIAQMVGQETSLMDQENLRERLGLNDPLTTQFVRFVSNLATGEFGFPYRTHQHSARRQIKGHEYSRQLLRETPDLGLLGSP